MSEEGTGEGKGRPIENKSPVIIAGINLAYYTEGRSGGGRGAGEHERQGSVFHLIYDPYLFSGCPYKHPSIHPFRSVSVSVCMSWWHKCLTFTDPSSIFLSPSVSSFQVGYS